MNLPPIAPQPIQGTRSQKLDQLQAKHPDLKLVSKEAEKADQQIKKAEEQYKKAQQNLIKKKIEAVREYEKTQVQIRSGKPTLIQKIKNIFKR